MPPAPSSTADRPIVRRRRLPTPWIIWWAVLMHTAWGAALMIDPTVGSLVILVGLHWIAGVGHDNALVGAVLVGISLLAVVSLILGRRLRSHVALALVAPQQVVLMAAFVSDLQTLVTGVVPGATTQVERVLLFTILWPVMIAAVLHSCALLERHRSWISPR